MRYLRALFAALAFLGLIASAEAASVTTLTGPQDPSQVQALLNSIILQLNGVGCTATGATPQTCNGTRGVVTTGTLTTAAVTNAAYVINNSSVVAASSISCSVLGYSGTLFTNGVPQAITCVPGAGTITVNLSNTHATNALNGTVTIGFTVNTN